MFDVDIKYEEGKERHLVTVTNDKYSTGCFVHDKLLEEPEQLLVLLGAYFEEIMNQVEEGIWQDQVEKK